MAVFLLAGVAGSCFAADAQGDPVQLAQFSSGQIGSEADFDNFDDEYAEMAPVADPLYYWNKTWFVFNDGLYHGLFKPLATGYAWVIPAKPRTWVNNFFVNMLFPVRFINNVLTGKFDAAYMEVSKFIANTAFGFGGFRRRHLRHAPQLGARASHRRRLRPDVGQGWLWVTALYLVWPLLGPSSIRESVGLVGDYFCDPLTYADLNLLEMIAIKSYKNVNALSLELEGNEYETLTEGAVDKYAAVRDAYIRYRAKKVAE